MIPGTAQDAERVHRAMQWIDARRSPQPRVFPSLTVARLVLADWVWHSNYEWAHSDSR